MKKEREEMKKKLKSLKEAQEPLLRKIRSVESQLQPIEQQMKELVSIHHKPDSQESILYFLYYIKIMPLFFSPQFLRLPVSEMQRRNVSRNMISLNIGIKRFVLKDYQQNIRNC